MEKEVKRWLVVKEKRENKLNTFSIFGGIGATLLVALG